MDLGPRGFNQGAKNMSKKNELVDITVNLLHETEMAVLVTDGDDEVWLPKSQIEYEIIDQRERTAVVTMPTWLAEKHDFF
jgi:hypothetical protein